MIVLTAIEAIQHTVKQAIDFPAWIAAVAALIGVPLSMVSLIKLVRRDKDREAQIAKLATIAIVLEAQNQTMIKQNDLLAQQEVFFGIQHCFAAMMVKRC